MKKKTYGSIGTRLLGITEGKAAVAQKRYEETKGKAGKQLAKKIANVGKPKKSVPSGTKISTKTYGMGSSKEVTSTTTEPTYTKVYSKGQRNRLKAAKATVSQMRTERGRTATRAAGMAKRASKKK